jgi:hypothetical protein
MLDAGWCHRSAHRLPPDIGDYAASPGEISERSQWIQLRVLLSHRDRGERPAIQPVPLPSACASATRNRAAEVVVMSGNVPP